MSTAFTLQLLHLSDGEAGLLAPTTAPNLAAMVDGFEEQYANTLILAGGDTFLPSPFLAAASDPSVTAALNAATGSTITGLAPIGAVDTAIHNLIGVEVSAIGNHEFDLGSNVFAGSIAAAGGFVGATYALVTANLDFTSDGALNPRFVNTVGDASIPTPEASSLNGRIAPAVVVTKGGEKIGILGATTQILETISSPSGAEVNGFPTGPGANGERDDMALLASQLQPIINEMIAEGIDKIILQSHLQNIANEKLLATLLTGVDIILAAGSNTRLGDANDAPVAFPGHAANFADTYPLVIDAADGGKTLIVNTDNEYTYLGRLKVGFDADGKVIVDNLDDDAAINGAYASTLENVAKAWNVDVADVEAIAFAEGTRGDKVRDLTDAVQAVISGKDGAVFGFTEVYLEGERLFVRGQETNLGSLTADANAFALREALGEDDGAVIVSLKNGGGIRAQIGTLSAPDPVDGSVDKLPPGANPAVGKDEGGVSQLDIENSLRFNNRLIAFDTTAGGLKAILEHGVASGAGRGQFPQIGGVAFSWDPDAPAGSRVSDIALLNGRGEKVFALFDDGVLQPGAPATITVVTLNFLANGGDGYPIKANGENFRYLLADGTLSAPIDETLAFTANEVTPPGSTTPVPVLGEQTALAEFLKAFHGTPDTAYDVADTPVSGDQRIQNTNFRDDTVLDDLNQVGTAGDDTLYGSADADVILATAGDDTIIRFGADDVLAVQGALRDGNGDGVITYGRNGILDVTGRDGRGDTISFIDGPAALRFLGTDGAGKSYYAEADVRPGGAREGAIGNDAFAGDRPDTKANLFFFDTALDLDWGFDTIRNFGAKDMIVTTSALRDDDGDGVIGFGADRRLDLVEAGEADGASEVAITGLNGRAVTKLFFNGSFETGGVEYFVYGLTDMPLSA